ncbi:MAG: hypothetical protein AAGI34_06170 [Pseudomonadota bacterium]
MIQRMLGSAALGAVLLVTPATAEDFAANSQARSWNLLGEEKARFSAEVVDVVCALTGDCPEGCGGGQRQMALKRTADDALILAAKNGQPAFSGATVDLAPYCGQTVEVDGLMIGDPEVTGLTTRIYMVQTIRPEGGETVKANTFTKVWAEQNPEATGKGPWFRRDPAINAEIAREGYLGLGKVADEAFISEWFAQ